MTPTSGVPSDYQLLLNSYKNITSAAQQQSQQQQQQQQHSSIDDQKADTYHSSSLSVAPSTNLTSLTSKFDAAYATTKMPSPSPDSTFPETSEAATNERINAQILNRSASTATTTFDYLYEFSETRKVLEDFFKCPNNEEEKKISECFNESDTGSVVSIFGFWAYDALIKLTNQVCEVRMSMTNKNPNHSIFPRII